jgi:hypothetical protein
MAGKLREHREKIKEIQPQIAQINTDFVLATEGTENTEKNSHESTRMDTNFSDADLHRLIRHTKWRINTAKYICHREPFDSAQGRQRTQRKIATN